MTGKELVAPGSMSGATVPLVDVYSFRLDEGRGTLLRVEDYGSPRVWVQDLEHPTGLGFWMTRDEVAKL